MTLILVILLGLSTLTGLTNANVKKVKITVTSVNCAMEKCNKCGSQIIIDSTDYSSHTDGLNFATFNPLTGAVKNVASIQKAHSIEQFLTTIPTGIIVIVTSQLLCSHEKTTDLRKQNAIINGFGKLGANVDIKPVLFRSGAYIFCKDRCFNNISKNIDFPVESFKNTKEDAVLISFSIDINQYTSKPLRTTVHSPVTSSVPHQVEKETDGQITLLLVACITPLFVLGVISLVICLFIRYRLKTLSITGASKRKRKHRIPLNEGAVKFCQCKKNTEEILMSDCKTPQVKHTTSFRLFHKSADTPASHKLSFATYVEVGPTDDDIEHEETCIYKVPSSLKRHAPPKHLPPLKQGNHEFQETKIDEYLEIGQHDYASVDEVGFISSSPGVEEPTDYALEFKSPPIDDQSASGFDRAKELYDRCSTSLRSATDQRDSYGYEDYIDPMN